MYYKSVTLRNGKATIGDYIEAITYGRSITIFKLTRIEKGDYNGMVLCDEKGYKYHSRWCRKLDVTDARKLLIMSPL